VRYRLSEVPDWSDTWVQAGNVPATKGGLKTHRLVPESQPCCGATPAGKYKYS
jgi:hypothetical protein